MSRDTQAPPTLAKHYATYMTEDGEAVYGFAMWLDEKGWLFDTEDGQWLVVCARTDARLHVAGLVELADAQLAEDLARRDTEAGRCAACGLIGCRGGATCDSCATVIAKLAAVMA